MTMAKKPARTSKRGPSAVRFPGESPKYRAAREKLLKSEIALRRQIEAVAAERRKLPLGGAVKEDYVFEELTTDPDHTTARRHVRLSQLFAPGKDTLVVYSYMFGPQMAAPCPMCTSMLDGLDGQAPHLRQRVNLAVVARSPIDRIREFARERGWSRLRLLSSAGNSYNRDYHGENKDGGQLPMLNVFTRKNGRIYHTYGSELLFAPSDRGQDGRHVDAIWPLWNVLDFTPEGRGTTWYPKLRYE
ncbi:MAG: DUF899 family protein [Acidobacteria bacterium]|nr:DUF899 family protein [Acidobacteriota bacterium]